MKLALATWNGRISPVFDVARQVRMLDIQDGCVVAREDVALPGTDPCSQAERLAALGPNLLICGALSRPMAGELAAKRVRVIPFTAGEVESVLAAWLAGTLPNPAMCMPGCYGRMGRCRGGRGRGRGQGRAQGQERNRYEPNG